MTILRIGFFKKIYGTFMDFTPDDLLVETIFIPEDIVRVNQLLRPLLLFIILESSRGFNHFYWQACPFIRYSNVIRSNLSV